MIPSSVFTKLYKLRLTDEQFEAVAELLSGGRGGHRVKGRRIYRFAPSVGSGEKAETEDRYRVT